MPDSNHVDIARRYANAYAAFDTAELRNVLAPDLRFRQVNPGGYLEVDSAQAYIDGTKAFLDGYDAHAAITATAEQLGDLVLTTSRMRLDQNGDRYLLQHSEIVTVAECKVTAIDSVCTGSQPERHQR